MAQHPESNGSSTLGGARGEIAQALQDLNRGEQTASQLERKLDSVEAKLDQLLKELEEGNPAHMRPGDMEQMQKLSEDLERLKQESEAEERAVEQEKEQQLEEKERDSVNNA